MVFTNGLPFKLLLYGERPWQQTLQRHGIAATENPCTALSRWCLQVSHSHLSIATLTQDVPLDKMCSVETAPHIKAVVVGKGADFANGNTSTDGIPLMPQVVFVE